MKPYGIVLSLAGFMAVPLCAGAQSTDHYGLRAAIDAGNKGFVAAFKRGDAHAMASLYASDGIDVSRTHMLRGRDTIERAFAARVGKVHLLDGSCDTDALVVDGTMASETGHCVYHFSGKPPSYGRFLTVWRYAGGTWHIQMNGAL